MIQKLLLLFCITAMSLSAFGQNKFNARFSASTPSNPENPVEVSALGEYPTSGWSLEVIRVETVADITEIEIEAIPPGGPAATVITPFDEVVAALNVSVGFHYVRGTINGETIPSIRFYNGEAPPPEHKVNERIWMKRIGGFAGDNSWISISRDGQYTLENQFQNAGEVKSGSLNDAVFQQLQSQFENAGFNRFPLRIEPENTVADAFQYELIYKDTGVVVEYLDAAPEALQSLIRKMEELLNNPQQTSYIECCKWKVYD